MKSTKGTEVLTIQDIAKTSGVKEGTLRRRRKALGIEGRMFGQTRVFSAAEALQLETPGKRGWRKGRPRVDHRL